MEIGIAPERTQYLLNNIHAKQNKYGLRHHVTSTVHTYQGDTLLSMVNDISQNNVNFKMWDKGQMIEILSCTKRARYTIFVGDKNYTLAALSTLLTRKTQWTDYMEEIIFVININSPTAYNLNPTESTRSRIMIKSTFTFHVCDVSFPQYNTGMFICRFLQNI